MRVTIPKYLWLFLGLLLLLSIRTPVIAQGAFLNSDPDFDGFFNQANGGSGPWIPYKISNPGPNVWKNGFEGFPKAPSLWIYGDNTPFDGGVYQSVAVTPGHSYHFQVDWATVRHGGAAVTENSLLVRQVGIDPMGGTNPIGPTVQWSAEYTGSGKPARDLVIDAYAVNDHITIFLRAQNRYADSRAEVFFDHAMLTENAGVPPVNVAFPTPVPTNTPAPTARPTIAAPTRTRAPRVVPTATDSPSPTDTVTPTPTSTDTPEPTATRTPASTATPPAVDPSSVSTRLALSLGTIICLGGGAGVVLLGLVVFLLRGRSV